MKAYTVAAIAASMVVALGVTVEALTASPRAELPNGWVLTQPPALMTETDTLPQGAAASPDGKTLAVVESGYNPPTLRIYDTRDLNQLASIPLKGAFGRPLWIDGTHVLVAGANADALLDVDVSAQSVRAIPMAKDSYPVAVAMSSTGVFAAATDGDASVRIGSLQAIAQAKPVAVGGHIGGLAFSSGGNALAASNRTGDSMVVVDTETLARRTIRTALHPSDILIVGDAAYVAQTDADSVGVYDLVHGTRLASIFVGDRLGAGVSPNAIARQGDLIFVSLGAANSVAVIENRRVLGRLAAGWYPTDIVPIGKRLYAIDGKGEGTRPNPYFEPESHSDNQYVAATQYGSIRAYEIAPSSWTSGGSQQGAQGWRSPGDDAIVRSGGPIKHVFFILKENRSYDQVLGDLPAGNGDRKLAWFDARVTPNEHALAKRFGLFDNTYTSGEVSDPGHNWADAAFVNDYVERVWPVIYGGRSSVDETNTGTGAGVPRTGYIWQAARAAHVSFRDYGEFTDPATPNAPVTTSAPSLRGLYDPHYVGWNLDYSDLSRVKEWRREFGTYLAREGVPQLEYIWLPNDHTYGSKVGKLTPVSYVAQNDYALGQIVDTISHSPIWSSSAIFVIEDDSQDGPDHVSGQRTTFFLVSPYAKGGLQHAHYATTSVLRTMELILGLQPLSTYDAMAVPLYDAFTSAPNLMPYETVPPMVSLTTRNATKAYGSKVSAVLDFTRPDAISPETMLNILAHNHAHSRSNERR